MWNKQTEMKNTMKELLRQLETIACDDTKEAMAKLPMSVDDGRKMIADHPASRAARQITIFLDHILLLNNKIAELEARLEIIGVCSSNYTPGWADHAKGKADFAGKHLRKIGRYK